MQNVENRRLSCAVRCWRSSTSVGLRLLVWWTTSTQDDGQRTTAIDQPKEIRKWFFVCSLEKCRSLNMRYGSKLLLSRPDADIVRPYYSQLGLLASIEEVGSDDGGDDDDVEFFNPTHFNRRADFPHLGLPVCVRRVCFHNFRFGLCANEFSTRRRHTDSLAYTHACASTLTSDALVCVVRYFIIFCLSRSVLVWRAMPLRICFCVHSLGLCI